MRRLFGLLILFAISCSGQQNLLYRLDFENDSLPSGFTFINCSIDTTISSFGRGHSSLLINTSGEMISPILNSLDTLYLSFDGSDQSSYEYEYPSIYLYASFNSGADWQYSTFINYKLSLNTGYDPNKWSPVSFVLPYGVNRIKIYAQGGNSSLLIDNFRLSNRPIKDLSIYPFYREHRYVSGNTCPRIQILNQGTNIQSCKVELYVPEVNYRNEKYLENLQPDSLGEISFGPIGLMQGNYQYRFKIVGNIDNDITDDTLSCNVVVADSIWHNLARVPGFTQYDAILKDSNMYVLGTDPYRSDELLFYRYSIKEDTWLLLKQMANFHEPFKMFLLNNKIYLDYGMNVWEYDEVNNNFNNIIQILFGYYNIRIAPYQDSLFYLLGNVNPPNVTVTNVNTGITTPASALPDNAVLGPNTIIGNKIYVFGRAANKVINKVLTGKISPLNFKEILWDDEFEMPPDIGVTGCVFPFNQSSIFIARNSVYLYNTESKSMSKVTDFPNAGSNYPTVMLYYKDDKSQKLFFPVHKYYQPTFEIYEFINKVIPVQLTHFSYTHKGNDISLKWQTATETNNKGFYIERKINDGDFIPLYFISGNGTSTVTQNYSYIDKNVCKGEIKYRLRQMDYNGEIKYSEILEVQNISNLTYSVKQNYPNPFNPNTKINYTLAEKQYVDISIYDILGNLVATLVKEVKGPGTYNINFDGSSLASGVYFYKMRAGYFTATKKMLLIK